MSFHASTREFRVSEMYRCVWPPRRSSASPPGERTSTPETMFIPFCPRSGWPRTRYADDDTCASPIAAKTETSRIHPTLICIREVTIAASVRNHGCVARQQFDVLFHAFALHRRVVVERHFLLRAVLRAQDVNLLALRIVGEPAGFADRLHHRHAIRIGQRTFLFSRAHHVNLLAVNLSHDYRDLRL